MSSYKQWAASKRTALRLTWVCGSERVLVSEVVGATTNAIGADDTEVFTAGQDSQKSIWAAVLAIPHPGYKRMIVIRDAGRLKGWDQLQSWMDSKNVLQGSYLLFEDSADDFPRDSDGKLLPPTTWLRDSTLGQLVRCSPLAMEDAVAWAVSKMPALSEAQARHLLIRASGDLGEVRTVLAKASLFSGKVSDAALDMLCAELPGDFAECVILGDRKGAMLAVPSLGADGLIWSIGLLASRLNTLSALHRAARDNVSRRDVTAKLGVPAFLAQKYAGIARDYGEARIARCWTVLAAAENACRSGVTEGVAEVLVVSW